MICNVIYSWNSDCKYKGMICEIIESNIRSAITNYPPKQEEIEELIDEKEPWELLANRWAAGSHYPEYDGVDYPYSVSERKMKAYVQKSSNKICK